jgi:glycosyltransferase involved in cell wall biosynthesis
LIDEAVKSFPDLVRYVGPVYGDAKKQFLQNIDALLFPTRYNEESWGIVLNEAFAAGAPVITFDRGCTKTVVGAKAGLVVDRDANFAKIAGNQVRQWITDESAYRSASQAAIDQAVYLSTEGNRMLDDFAERIFREQ